MAEQRHPVAAERPVVALCAGKDCKKRCEFAKMYDALDARCDVVELKCVGICSGPVVVAHAASDAPIVFSKVRTKQQRKQLLRIVVDGGSPSNELAKRVVTNGKRTATLRRVRRALR